MSLGQRFELIAESVALAGLALTLTALSTGLVSTKDQIDQTRLARCCTNQDIKPRCQYAMRTVLRRRNMQGDRSSIDTRNNA
eukprot:6184463-Pleurochrysis_carterae.AAC.3